MILRRVLIFGNLQLLFTLYFPGIEAQASVAVPFCAVNCLSDALLQSSCFQTDVRCLCQSSGYVTAVADCISEVCNELDQKQARQYATENCRSNGVALSLPGASSTSTGTATSESTTTSAGSTTTSATGSVSTTLSTTTTSVGDVLGASAPSGTPAAKETGSDQNSAQGASNGGGGSTNTGAIVGGVVGGVGAIALILVGTWLVMRERRKRMAMATSLPSTAPEVAQPDMNSQSIWTGDNTYSWNPQRDGHGIQGGIADR
ncbi:hypothetical protein TWF696_005834 [Orbilia brochopaga]|uniref:CFEM domain-containing protein n=1 Tax=Orbilia brochopaga TaxID=3140254 RepID=A0AAV9UUH6_9PEZI